MISEEELLGKICDAASAFYYATGEIPNVVYVSEFVYPSLRSQYPYVQIAFMEHTYYDLLAIDEELQANDYVKDVILSIKKHKNEAGYTATESVYVCREEV